MPSPPQRDDLFRGRIEQFTRMLRGLEKGHVRALHRTRVATRRLRELLPVLPLKPDAAEKLNRRLRKATERLGSVRELDVLMLLVRELHESDRYPPEALTHLAAAVDKQRKARRKKLMAKAPIAELHGLAHKLESISGELAAGDRAKRGSRTSRKRDWRWAAEARVARRAGGFRDAIDAAGAVYLQERLHTVRIALKKLRYAMEVMGEAGGSIAGADLRTLKQGQDFLGRLHDRQILIDYARQIQASLTPPSVVTWQGLEALVEMLEHDCRRLHGRYMRERDALIAVCGRLAGQPRAAARRDTA